MVRRRMWRAAISNLSASLPIGPVEAMIMKRLALLASLALASLPVAFAVHAQAPAVFDQLKRADGAKVVPDRFLRSWDPVTLFFDQDLGPAAGGPEDHPERL